VITKSIAGVEQEMCSSFRKDAKTSSDVRAPFASHLAQVPRKNRRFPGQVRKRTTNETSARPNDGTRANKVPTDRKLHANAVNTDEFTAAYVPALATRHAPQNLRAYMHGECLLCLDRDFNFAGRQLRIVQ
jgi:hypothetical protein